MKKSNLIVSLLIALSPLPALAQTSSMPPGGYTADSLEGILPQCGALMAKKAYCGQIQESASVSAICGMGVMLEDAPEPTKIWGDAELSGMMDSAFKKIQEVTQAELNAIKESGYSCENLVIDETSVMALYAKPIITKSNEIRDKFKLLQDKPSE